MILAAAATPHQSAPLLDIYIHYFAALSRGKKETCWKIKIKELRGLLSVREREKRENKYTCPVCSVSPCFLSLFSFGCMQERETRGVRVINVCGQLEGGRSRHWRICPDAEEAYALQLVAIGMISGMNDKTISSSAGGPQFQKGSCVENKPHW